MGLPRELRAAGGDAGATSTWRATWSPGRTRWRRSMVQASLLDSHIRPAAGFVELLAGDAAGGRAGAAPRLRGHGADRGARLPLEQSPRSSWTLFSRRVASRRRSSCPSAGTPIGSPCPRTSMRRPAGGACGRRHWPARGTRRGRTTRPRGSCDAAGTRLSLRPCDGRRRPRRGPAPRRPLEERPPRPRRRSACTSRRATSPSRANAERTSRSVGSRCRTRYCTLRPRVRHEQTSSTQTLAVEVDDQPDDQLSRC